MFFSVGANHFNLDRVGANPFHPFGVHMHVPMPSYHLPGGWLFWRLTITARVECLVDAMTHDFTQVDVERLFPHLFLLWGGEVFGDP